MAMDPNKKRLVQPEEFKQLKYVLPEFPKGKNGKRTSPFSETKHHYYTKQGLEGGGDRETDRTRYFMEVIGEISEDVGPVVPYAFVEGNGKRRSMDAACLASVGPDHRRLVKYVVDDGFITGVTLSARAERDNSANSTAKIDTENSGQGDALDDLDLGADLEQILENGDLSTTERLALVMARIGHGGFRREVLKEWNNCCAVTGSQLSEVLRASHIVPWKEADSKQRLDPANGLPLVATLDALFDRGLISVASSGQLLINEEKMGAERTLLGGFTSLRNKPSQQTERYLTEHRRKHGFKDDR